MRYPNFGFDIDDVVFDSYEVINEAIKSELGIDVSERPTSFHLEKVTNTGKDETKLLINNALKQNDKILPMFGAIEFIKKYYQITSKYVVFITSRPEFLQEYTKDLIDKWIPNIPYAIYFADIEMMNKAQIARRENLDVFIDDRIKYCLQISDGGMLALMMEQAWNKKFVNYNDDNIVKVKDWDQVEVIFNLMSCKNQSQ